MTLDCRVIGAGLAGLTAAATLRGAEANVRVIDASAEIGGRIRALRDPDSSRALADLGPTWVWPRYQPVAARWLDRLGIRRSGWRCSDSHILTGASCSRCPNVLPSARA